MKEKYWSTWYSSNCQWSIRKRLVSCVYVCDTSCLKERNRHSPHKCSLGTTQRRKAKWRGFLWGKESPLAWTLPTHQHTYAFASVTEGVTESVGDTCWFSRATNVTLNSQQRLIDKTLIWEMQGRRWHVNLLLHLILFSTRCVEKFPISQTCPHKQHIHEFKKSKVLLLCLTGYEYEMSGCMAYQKHSQSTYHLQVSVCCG